MTCRHCARVCVCVCAYQSFLGGGTVIQVHTMDLIEIRQLKRDSPLQTSREYKLQTASEVCPKVDFHNLVGVVKINLWAFQLHYSNQVKLEESDGFRGRSHLYMSLWLMQVILCNHAFSLK